MKTLAEFTNYLEITMPDNLNEISKARYVYIELGKIVYYDINFALANSRNRKKISRNFNIGVMSLNKIFENKAITCDTLPYIYKHLLDVFEIKSYINKYSNYDPLSNIIVTKDKKSYAADLQFDLQNIQSRSKTNHFATSENNLFSTVNYETLKEIDKSIFYINDDYTDSSIQNFRKSIPDDFTLDQKIEFIMNYLYSNKITQSMKLIESNNYHKHVFNKLINIKLIKNIHYSFCYNESNGYFSFISVNIGKLNSKIYVLNEKNNEYLPISENRLIYMLKNGTIIKCGTLLTNKKYFTNTSSFKKL